MGGATTMRCDSGAAPCWLAVWGAGAPCSLPFHHCCDIWASISSIFLSVPARSSGEVMLFEKNEARARASSRRRPPWASRWRSLRS